MKWCLQSFECIAQNAQEKLRFYKVAYTHTLTHMEETMNPTRSVCVCKCCKYSVLMYEILNF